MEKKADSASDNEFIVYNELKIDPVIFTQGFVPGCNVGICDGQCCDWGVYMDKEFQSVIMKYENEIKEVMDEFQFKDSQKWFEKELEEDSDFPSGYAVGTEMYINSRGTTQCVFKDKNNFCSLQVMALKKQKHKWEIKPMYCILYPLTIVGNVLTYDNHHSKRLDYCGMHHPENFTQSVFEAMSEEIKYVIGQDAFDFMNDYFMKNFKNAENNQSSNIIDK